jgi:hypothetical protein
MPNRSPGEQVRKYFVDFLQIDPETAFTFPETAARDVHSDPEHARIAIGKVRPAPDTIRRLVVRVEDAGMRAAVISRQDELEAAIDRVSV